MTGNREFMTVDIGAYLDGEMTDVERANFEDWLAENTATREQLADYENDLRYLRAAMEPVLLDPIPDRLMATIETVGAKNGAPMWWRALAAALLLAIGIAMGWAGAIYRGQLGIEVAATPTQALNAHQVYVSEILHPVEVTSDQQEHLVTWLSKRLGHLLIAPDLEREGFHLVGGRLLPGDSGAAAQFMYEDATGLRTTLYVALNPEGQDTAFRLAKSGATQTFYWFDGRLGYAITADLDEKRLLALAHAVYGQISGDGGAAGEW